MRIAVLLSGNGSNLQALIDASARDNLGGGDIVCVISDKEGAYGLERAEIAGIEALFLDTTGTRDREEYDSRVLAELKKRNVDLVVLAGYMRIVSGKFVEAFKGRIMNIHPALLPAFKGAHGISDAFEHGVKVSGVTVHFVTAELDDGPIILQEPVCIKEDDTEESFEEKIHAVEHKLYPEAVRLFAEDRLRIEGRTVHIK